jgi:hypothetical protein
MAINIPVPDYSNATTLEQKFEILADSYNMLRKELDYVLQNLSAENFNSIFANNITAKNLKGGNININDAFLVDSEGNVEMLGDISLSGTIIVHDPMTLEAMDAADGAYIVATTASGNIAKLANGTYVGGTFITGKSISSPYIEGGEIEGIDIIGSYFKGSSSNSAYIIIGTRSGNLGDLKFYRGGSPYPLFQIYDNVPGISMKVLNEYNVEKTILETGGDTTKPKGNWDFSGANVTGVPLRFGS